MDNTVQRDRLFWPLTSRNISLGFQAASTHAIHPSYILSDVCSLKDLVIQDNRNVATHGDISLFRTSVFCAPCQRRRQPLVQVSPGPQNVLSTNSLKHLVGPHSSQWSPTVPLSPPTSRFHPSDYSSEVAVSLPPFYP